jgi:RNA polymerase sigma factor (sigma-70 family)
MYTFRRARAYEGVMIALGLDEGVTVEVARDFDSFFRAHFERVARAGALVARDPGTGQDLAQEAFARLFERWGSMASDDHAKNFVYKVAINLAKSHLRRHLRVSFIGLRRSDEAGGVDPAARSDDWLQVADALRSLSPRQRTCVVLVDYADMDAAGAARVLGMRAGTVRVHLMRGRRALRERLGVAGGGGIAVNADQQLRERLDRAAEGIRVDTERRLDEIHRSVPHRQRVRRVATLAIAAIIGLASVGILWEFLHLRASTTIPGADVGPSGRIAYMRLTKPLDQKDASDLFVLDVASGRVTVLHEGAGFSVYPRWSPDGTRLAYVSNETGEGGIGIFVAGADGADPVDILEGGSLLEDGGPISLSWAPDGSRIAFVGKDPSSGETAVWTMNPDGTDRQTVLDGHWEAVSWSPDGGRLLLAGVPTGADRFDLYTVRLDGSGLLQLTDDEVIERSPSWSPDGARIAFAERTVEFANQDYGQDVFVMDADGSNRRRLTEWKGFDSFAAWAPDGDWIVFASDRDATPEQQRGNGGNQPLGGVSLYVMRPDGSDVRLVLDGDPVALLPSSWST